MERMPLMVLMNSDQSKGRLNPLSTLGLRQKVSISHMISVRTKILIIMKRRISAECEFKPTTIFFFVNACLIPYFFLLN